MTTLMTMVTPVSLTTGMLKTMKRRYSARKSTRLSWLIHLRFVRQCPRYAFICFLFDLTLLTFFLQLRQLSFAIIHSTTIALPAWQRICQAHGLKDKLIPRDVVMRWNSTHDMMVFALEYRKPIDSITADKSLKLQRYELDNKGWGIIEQLVSVLQVSIFSLSLNIC